MRHHQRFIIGLQLLSLEDDQLDVLIEGQSIKANIRHLRIDKGISNILHTLGWIVEYHKNTVGSRVSDEIWEFELR